MTSGTKERVEHPPDDAIWLEVSELWRILRYKSPGSHQAKLKATQHLKQFIGAAVEREGAREALAKWMIAHNFATGHGDTFQDLLGELSWQIEESRRLRNVAETALEEAVADCKVPEGYNAAQIMRLIATTRVQAKEIAALAEKVKLAIGFCVDFRERVPDWRRFREVGVLFSKLTGERTDAG